MTINEAMSLNEADLITSILSSFFIVDYGYINKVNPDKTVNITHACLPVLEDGTELGETTTDNVEVLTISGAGFSLQWDYKPKDRVLILGLKDYIKSVADVEKAEAPKAYFHYNRSTIKVVPLSLFSDEAKVKIVVEDGSFTVTAEDKVNLDGSDNGGVVIAQELTTQLGYLTQRVDTIINALQNAPTAAEDGGAAYKAGIASILATIANKEDFSNIESQTVFHGTGE